MKNILSTHGYLQLHVHTAGQSFSGCSLYCLSAETESMTPVLHGLDKRTLKNIKEDFTTKTVNCPTNLAYKLP